MIYLSKEIAEEIKKHALEGAPNEICGIIAGRFTSCGDNSEDSKAEKLYKMTNTNSSSTTFFMEPKEQLKVAKEIRGLGLKMVGIYHSHPDTEGYPSKHDVEYAFYPEVSYVIVSLKVKASPVIRSYRIEEGKINEEEVSAGGPISGGNKS